MPAPEGYVDMKQAIQITGYTRETITRAAAAGEIPGALQRLRKSPRYFTPDGLRRWLGIPVEEDAESA